MESALNGDEEVAASFQRAWKRTAPLEELVRELQTSNAALDGLATEFAGVAQGLERLSLEAFVEARRRGEAPARVLEALKNGVARLLTRMRQSPESVEVDSGTELVAYTLPGLRSELSAAKYGELLKATTTNNNPSSSSNAVMDFCSPDTQNRGDREGGGAGGHTKASRADLPHIGRRE